MVKTAKSKTKSIDSLEKQKEAQAAEEWKSKYIRALADYQNLEKRIQNDAVRLRDMASEKVIADLIPVIDMLALADVHLNDRGLKMALQELYAVLSKFGVVRIRPEHVEFDPDQMECIEVVEGSKNQVTEVVLPGFMMNGKLLRPAKVKVGG